MSFEFCTEFDESMSKTFGNLILTNNGFFKSLSQSKFIKSRLQTAKEGEVCCSIVLNEGDLFLVVQGFSRFADYGYRSRRRVENLFVFDEFGIKSRIKIKFNYSSDGKSSWVDPNGAQVTWSRPVDVEVPVILKTVVPVEETLTQKIIGNKGDKIECKAKIEKIISFNSVPTFRWESGIRFKTIMKRNDDGAVIVYWGYLKNSTSPENLLKIGDTVQLKATIKDMNVYKGTVENIVQRPKAILIEE